MTRRESLGTGSAFGVALSADPQQRFMYVADGSNERIAILDRNTLELIGSIGPGTQSGEFFHLYSIATDLKGNIILVSRRAIAFRSSFIKGPNSEATGRRRIVAEPRYANGAICALDIEIIRAQSDNL